MVLIRPRLDRLLLIGSLWLVCQSRSAAEPNYPGALQPVGRRSPTPIPEVTTSTGVLPNDHGQHWREYDIRPYTARVTSTARPERTLVEWVLRETPYDAWHSEVVSVLAADRERLRVYHTPEMQRTVEAMVDRFVNLEASNLAVGVRVLTVSHPNWRARALPALRAMPSATTEIQAWLLAKEDAALVLAELQKRIDVREHSAPNTIVLHGESVVVAASRPRTFVKNILATANGPLQSEPGQILEGFSLEVSPLFTVDGRFVDAFVHCRVDQVEKTIPVALNVSDPSRGSRRTRIEVPQVAAFVAQERFQWPSDQVLLVSLGVIPSPITADPSANLLGVPLPTATGRAEFLILLETKGRLDASPDAATAGRRARDLLR